MQAALVKIDVAAACLGKSATHLFGLAEGGFLGEPGLEWVFNLANDPEAKRRDLRFWLPELQTRTNQPSNHPTIQPSILDLEAVVAQILPLKRQNFHAGEVDQLLQIRPRTRIDFGEELGGTKQAGRNFYERDMLAAFLRRRWLGAQIVIKQ